MPMLRPPGKKGTAIMLVQNCCDLELIFDEDFKVTTEGNYFFYWQTEGRKTHGIALVRGLDKVEVHHTQVGTDAAHDSSYVTHKVGLKMLEAVHYLQELMENEAAALEATASKNKSKKG